MILSGLRVIDCGTYIAGPAAAAILSDFGAEVIKIERPPYGDPYRYLSQVPGMPVSDKNYCWILDDRNKKSIALDLSDRRSPPGSAETGRDRRYFHHQLSASIAAKIQTHLRRPRAFK